MRLFINAINASWLASALFWKHLFTRIKVACDSRWNTQRFTDTSPAARASSSIQRSSKMATLFQFFKKQSFPTSIEAELQDVVTRDANNAVKDVLEEEGNRASGRKRKYTHFTSRAKIAKYAAQCGNAATVNHFAKEFQPCVCMWFPALFKQTLIFQWLNFG